MPFETYRERPGSVGIGPNSPFRPGQTVNIPGIGSRVVEDYGPDVRGLDIPVTSERLMRDPAVNRMVTINGHRVPLTGYMPSNYDPRNVDPTGGGPLGKYTNRPLRPWTGTTDDLGRQSPGNVTDPDPFDITAQNAVSSPGKVTDAPFARGIPTRVPDTARSIEPLNIPFAGPIGNEPTTAPYLQPANIPTSEGMLLTGPNEYRSSSPGGMSPYDRDYDYGGGVAAAPVPIAVSSPGEITDDPFASGGVGPMSAYNPNYDYGRGVAPSSPGEVTDQPFAGGYPEVSSPGEITDDPFAGGYPPETMSYPDGKGGYTDINSTTGEPAPQATHAYPQLSDRPGTVYSDVGRPEFGGWGQPMGYFAPGTSGPGPLSNFIPGGITYGDVLASGVTPRTFAPGQVGSSSVPAPGGLGGIYGQGTGGDIPWFGRLAMRAARAGNPTLGLAGPNAITQFASHIGKIPVPSNISQYYSVNRGGVIGDIGAARGMGGPNARATAAT